MLPSTLDLYHVEEILPDLLERETLPETIDLSEIEKLSTAGVQLLLSIANTAQKLGAPCAFKYEDNDVVSAALNALRVDLTNVTAGE